MAPFFQALENVTVLFMAAFFEMFHSLEKEMTTQTLGKTDASKKMHGWIRYMNI